MKVNETELKSNRMHGPARMITPESQRRRHSSTGRLASLLALVCSLLATACHDDSPGASERGSLVPGGGVAGPAVADELSVFVVDAATGQKIAGASVGDGSGLAVQTDATGVARLAVSEQRPLRVHAGAQGYVPATWQGMLGAALTVPLIRRDYEAPFTTVSGTLEGFSSLSPSRAGRYLMARFEASQKPDLDSLDTNVARDSSETTSCRQTEVGQGCQFSLRVPSSQRAIFAVLAEGDDAGTPEDLTDDHFEMVGLGVARGLELRRGDALANVRVQLLDRQMLLSVLIDPSKAPDLSSAVVGVPGVNADGDVLVFGAFGEQMTSFLVPSKQSDLGPAKLWTVATWQAQDSSASSRGITRIDSLPDGATSPLRLGPAELLNPPVVAQVAGARISVTNGKGLITARAYAGTALVAEVVLAAAAPSPMEFSLPTEAAAADSVIVTVHGAELDPKSFSLNSVRANAPSITRKNLTLAER
jgi:hypothetical protein